MFNFDFYSGLIPKKRSFLIIKSAPVNTVIDFLELCKTFRKLEPLDEQHETLYFDTQAFKIMT